MKHATQKLNHLVFLYVLKIIYNGGLQTRNFIKKSRVVRVKFEGGLRRDATNNTGRAQAPPSLSHPPVVALCSVFLTHIHIQLLDY